MNLRYAGAVLVILLAGCSASHTAPSSVLPGAPSSTLVPHSGAPGALETPQLAGHWSSKAAMPTARYGLAVGVVNGILYAVGGYGFNGILNTLEAYDPATNTWITKAPMPTARGDLAVSVVNGVLYAVGGVGGGPPLSTVEAYDPSRNTWSEKSPMPTAREYLAVGVVKGLLYVVGGSGDCGSYCSTVEAYNPATNAWSTKASMPTARCCLSAGVLGRDLYAVGGYNGFFGKYLADLRKVESYNPATDAWTTKASMPTRRRLLAVGVVNKVLYAVGGFNRGGILNTVEAFTP